MNLALSLANVNFYTNPNLYLEDCKNIMNYQSTNSGTQETEVTDKYRIGVEHFKIPHAYESYRYHSSVVKFYIPTYLNGKDSTLTFNVINGDLKHIQASFIANYDINHINLNSEILTKTNNQFIIPLEKAISIAQINNYNEVYLKLSMSYSGGFWEIYSNSSSSKPSFSFPYIENPDYTDFGTAKEYIKHTPTVENQEIFKQNCFNYAINSKTQSGILQIMNFPRNQPFDPSFLKNELPSLIIKSALTQNVILRQIAKFESPLYINERRIAFKVEIKNNNFYDFHFLKQTNNGYWEGKYPANINELYKFYNPEEFNRSVNHTYSKETLFFAVNN